MIKHDQRAQQPNPLSPTKPRVAEHGYGLGVPSSYLGPSSPPQAGVSGCPLYGVGAPPGVGASAP